MKIKSLEETCLFSLPTRDSEIIEFFLSTSLKDEPLKTMPVQDRGWPSVQVKVFVASGDYNGHISHGVRCSKELATAIQEATIILAKLPTLPVWRGYWRNKLGKCHSSMQGNRQLCLCWCISSLPHRYWYPVPKKLLLMARQYR